MLEGCCTGVASDTMTDLSVHQSDGVWKDRFCVVTGYVKTSFTIAPMQYLPTVW